MKKKNYVPFFWVQSMPIHFVLPSNQPYSYSELRQSKFPFTKDPLPSDTVQFSGKYRKELTAAAKRGDLGKVEELVSQGASKNDCSKALRGSAQAGHTSIVKYLAQQEGIDLNQKSTYRRDTALSLSAANGDTGTTLLLLAAGANPKDEKAHRLAKKGSFQTLLDILKRIKQGESASAMAARYCDAKTLEDVLDLEANPNGTSKDPTPPLVIASEKGDLNMISLLLERNAAPNLPDRTTGQNAILRTAIADNVPTEVRKKVIHRLYAEGGNIDHADFQGETPLITSTKARRPSMVDTIAGLGANLSIKDHSNKTAMDYSEGSTSPQNVLLAHINRKENVMNNTLALHSALRGKDLEKVKNILRETKIDPDWQDDEQHTALSLASSRQYPSEVIDQILSLRPDVNIPGYEHRTPLFWTTYYNQTDKAHKLLKSHQADPNIADFSGVLPIMWAASHGNNEMVELLIQRGADITLKDNQEQAASSYAKHNGHFELARKLKILSKSQMAYKDNKSETSSPSRISEQSFQSI